MDKQKIQQGIRAGIKLARTYSELSREWLSEKWTQFRGHSVYFQLKTLILLSYGMIVAVTILWAPPTSKAQNQIGATIVVLEGDMVVGRYFVIHNESHNHWQDVLIEIDNGFQVKHDLVPAGAKLTLYVKDFKKKVIRKRRGKEIPKTVSAPVDMPLTELRLQCNEGVAVEPLVDSES